MGSSSFEQKAQPFAAMLPALPLALRLSGRA